MELQTVDLVVMVFFLSALVLVARSRKQLSSESKESYRYISTGMVVLTLMELSRLFSIIGAFSSIPFISDPVFYRLIFWIGIITGLTMLVNGVSRWLPLARSNRELEHMRLRRLDLIKRVEQLIAVENRMPVILSKVLDYMVKHYELKNGAIYIYSRRKRKLVFLSSSSLSLMPECELVKVSFDEDLVDNYANKETSFDNRIVTEVPSSITQPDLALPLVVEGKVSAVFLLWQGGKLVMKEEDRMNMKIAVDIIARKVEFRKLQLGEEFRRQQVDWLSSLVNSIDYKKRLKENMSNIAGWFTRMVSVDFISFTVIYNNNDMQRFSIGEEGNLLSEKRVNVLSHHTFLNHILESEKQVVVNDTCGKTSVPIDKMILGSGMKSLVAFRLGHGDKAVGAVVFASKAADHFSAQKIELIKGVLPLLNQLVSDEIHRHYISVVERRIGLLNSFLADCGRLVRLRDLFEQAALFLSREIRTSVVRISTYEYGNVFLKSRALVHLRPIEGITPADGHMILSLMPYHTLVRETGRLMMINQDHTDKKITEAEAKQICGSNLKSALLIPVTVNRQVLAVISFAEMRRWERYQYNQDDVLFACSVASGLSLAIQLALGKRTKTRPRLKEDGLGSVKLHDPALKSSIKSSLSSILGSVEIIKAHQPDTNTSLNRYLSIIDRSAHRINNVLHQEVSP